jgi:tetratricopeptide (TPR) repeat protein
LDPDRVAQARRRLQEAAGCFEQAVARAPDESEAHLRRALHRTLEGYLLNSIGQASGESKPDSEVVREFFPLESLADLKRASRLEPKDYSLAGNAALYEIYCVNAQRGRRGLGEGFDWTTLPDATQRSLRETIARLENLADDPDPKAASGALEVLGTLEGPVLRQTSRCVDTLQRALALDPARQRAWEILAGTLARTGRYDDLLAVCADHLRQENTSRAHILLAKAYEKLKQYDDAEEEVLEAIKLSDSDASATLSLAVLLLKRAQDEDTLGDADGWLSRCAQLLSATPPAQRNRQLIIDYTLTRGIYYALADDFDAARQWVQTVLQSDPGNESAKEILSALAY